MCPHSSQRTHSPASQVHRRIVVTGSVSRLPHRVHDSSGGDIAWAFPMGEEGVELKAKRRHNIADAIRFGTRQRAEPEQAAARPCHGGAIANDLINDARAHASVEA